jgi:hypothetical protein
MRPERAISAAVDGWMLRIEAASRSPQVSGNDAPGHALFPPVSLDQFEGDIFVYPERGDDFTEERLPALRAGIPDDGGDDVKSVAHAKVVIGAHVVDPVR